MECKARLRGLHWIIYSKTISLPWAHGSPCRAGVSVILAICRGDPGWSGPQGLPDLSLPEAKGAKHELQQWPSRPSAISYRLSAIQGKARRRETRTPTVTLSTIGYQLLAIG